MKKILAFIFALIMLTGFAQSQETIQTWISLNFSIKGDIKAFSYRHEMRYEEGFKYLALDHFDFAHRLTDRFTASVSLRGISTNGTREWRPMLNLMAKFSGVSNRIRLTYKSASKRLRMRNKTVFNASPAWFAHEIFIEEGKIFRSRYYVGLVVGNKLRVKPFVLRQNTYGSGQWIYGVDISFGF